MLASSSSSAAFFTPGQVSRGVFAWRGPIVLRPRGIAQTSRPSTQGIVVNNRTRKKNSDQKKVNHIVSPTILLPHSSRRLFVTASAAPSTSTSNKFIPQADLSTSTTSSVTPTLSHDDRSQGSDSDQPVLTFQDAVARLQQYWKDRGCVVWHPYNTELGAGTMNPATFLRVLGPEPWAVAYNEPSVRPDDSRYGENPNRLQCHTQFQVIVKPAPDCAQELVVASYRALGIDVTKRDIRFVEDNWESPALGAWGLGWEVWLDGMEITQFTYFQQAGSIGLDTVSVEITYGLERIIMALQGKTHFKDILYAPGVTYGEIFMQNEVEMSKYNLDEADMPRSRAWFDDYEAEAMQLLEKRLPIPAYNYLLKASHIFNVLDSRGGVGVTERARYFQRMRSLSREVAQLWIERREELQFPLLSSNLAYSANISLGGTDRLHSSEFAEQSAAVDAERSVLDDLGSECMMVFELGVEELPAGDVVNAKNQLRKLFVDMLSDARLSHDGLEVDATPRRIIIKVLKLQTRQENVVRRVRGPPIRAALGSDGELTKAGFGFLKSQGLSDSSQAEFDQESGYMYAVVQVPGRNAGILLTEMLPTNVLPKIGFTKTMRWNSTGVSFSRPIRWMLCLLDNIAIPFEYAGIASGRTTRTLRGENGFAVDVPVASASDFADVLAKNQIVSSRTKRLELISCRAVELAESIDGVILEADLNGTLIQEIVDLVESPLPLLGRFDEEFLKLPQDVLITVMKKHQRYLPVVDRQGDLLNAFIAVANGNCELVDMDAIRAGNEAVLRARYADASFFYKKDTCGKKLEDFLPVLSGLCFQEKLGSMLDKVERVKRAIPRICELMGLSVAETRTAEETARLFKADLGTSMVIEMTSLAGIMGRHYAMRSGEVGTEVAEGIFEAALPRFSGDAVARSGAGAAVGIADRLDSLASLFSVGLMPKSTADPFALRRAALGIVQTLIAGKISVHLPDAIAALTEDEEVGEYVMEFICKRLESYLGEQGFRADCVKAVLAVGRNRTDPYEAFCCASTLQQSLLDDDVLRGACEVHGRALRLVRSVLGGKTGLLSGDGEKGRVVVGFAVDEGLFEESVEGDLFHAVCRAEAGIREDGSLGRRLVETSEMKGVLDAFCDGVFVASEDGGVRKNRVSMLRRVVELTGACVDLSLMQL